MNINIDSLVTFLFIWGTPLVLMSWAYLKMDADDRKSAMNDFKSRRFIVTIGSVTFGAFLIHLGSVLSVQLLETIGLFILALGGIFSIITTWKSSKGRSLLIFALICFMIYLNVS
ncbi:hypothetical protein [Planococcus sp. ISL-110]|uniref:hypothetical protein n=1 Tax=Planococcus sp. ISL-110 TaxID=2819167 RepID=UPI001BECB0D2|nr:hypothetical protein [Planococcus sp. ISL-110]MBT2570029.1 hypothetical protein [Planococcus sp. ISL-110]